MVRENKLNNPPHVEELAPFHVLPSDYDSVQRALIDGKPIPVGSALGKAMVQMGERLEQKDPETTKKGASSSTWGGLLSLFSRTN